MGCCGLGEKAAQVRNKVGDNNFLVRVCISQYIQFVLYIQGTSLGAEMKDWGPMQFERLRPATSQRNTSGIKMKSITTVPGVISKSHG